MVNSLEVTISGEVSNTYYLPNDTVWDSHYCVDHYVAYNKPRNISLNLVNVETFQEITYPILEHVVTEKKVNWLARLLFVGTSKLYDVEHRQVGTKKVTWIKMRSGAKYMVDESASLIQNALDACVWTADVVK